MFEKLLDLPIPVRALISVAVAGVLGFALQRSYPLEEMWLALFQGIWAAGCALTIASFFPRLFPAVEPAKRQRDARLWAAVFFTLGLMVMLQSYRFSEPWMSLRYPVQTSLHLVNVNQQMSQAMARSAPWAQAVLGNSDDAWLRSMEREVSSQSQWAGVDLADYRNQIRNEDYPEGDRRLRILLTEKSIELILVVVGAVCAVRLAMGSGSGKEVSPALDWSWAGPAFLLALFLQNLVYLLTGLSFWFYFMGMMFGPAAFLFVFLWGSPEGVTGELSLEVLLAVAAADLFGCWAILTVGSWVGLEVHWTDWAWHLNVGYGPFESLYSKLLTIIWLPICEELGYRGLLFGGLRSRFGFAKAAILSSLAFALGHFCSLLTSLTIFWGGLVFCWLYEKTGSLRACIVWHICYNALEIWALQAWY